MWWQPFTGEIVRWWVLVVLLGWISYPLAFRAASLLPDRGVLFSKLLGLVLPTLLAVWLAYLGWGGAFAVRLAVLLVVLVNGVLLALSWPIILQALRESLRCIVLSELAFLAAFLAFLWMRSYFADATYDAVGWYGAEKWVNLGLLTGFWRDFAIPPIDPWLAGEPVNYYYFSHAMWAVASRLARVAPSVGFNLALATLFALLLQASFGAGWAVARRAAGGWWAAFLVAMAGPPSAWEQVGRIWRRLGDSTLGQALRSFDFWAPSDVVDATRNEFPAFNWLLGDLHAHGTGLLLLLAAVVLLVQISRARETEAAPWRSLALRQPAAWLLVGLIAVMWTTNGWDVAVLALLGIVWVAGVSVRHAVRAGEAAAQAVQGLLLGGLAALAAIGLLAAFYSGHTSLPLTMHSAFLAGLPGPLAALGGIGLVDSAQHTRPGEWLLYWGLFAGAGLALSWLRPSGRRPKGGFWNSPWLARVLWVAVVAALAVHGGGRVPYVGFALLGLAVWAMWRLLRCGAAMDESAWWILVFLVAVAGATALAEFVYVDDPIEAPYNRYNTVFKLWYPCWALAALALATALSGSARFIHTDAPVEAFDPLGGVEPSDATDESSDDSVGIPPDSARRLGVWLVALAVLVVGGLYPVLGIASRIEKGRHRMASWIDRGLDPAVARTVCRTLDGALFMALPSEAPDDLRLGDWMRRNVDGPGWLAEASGESYSMVGRFAVLSGVPCVMGWQGHETQWRGVPFAGDQWSRRAAMLERVYDAKDVAEIRDICRRTGIRWVAVGSIERRLYSAEALERVADAGREVARFGESALYEVVEPSAGPDDSVRFVDIRK